MYWKDASGRGETRRAARLRRAVRATAFLLSACAAPQAWAQASDGPAADRREAGDWSIALGAGVLANPKFSGSKELEFIPLPRIDIAWRDRIFLNNEEGLGVWLFKRDDDPDAALGISIGYEFDAREFDGDPRYAGLGETDGTVEARVLGEFELGLIDFEIEAAQAVSKSGHDGFRLTAGAGVGLPIGEHGYVGVGPFAVWANGKYMRSLYGVTPAEALRSSFRAYRPGGGVERVGAELDLRLPLFGTVAIEASAEYSRLLGDAADSPFIETRDQFEALVALTVKF